MRERIFGASGLLLAFALVTCSSVSFAAPAKRHKAKAAAPAPAPAADSTLAPEEVSAKPDEKPAPVVEAQPVEAAPKPVQAQPLVGNPKPDLKVARKTEDEPAAGPEDDTLGRRERLRLASGRTEVGVALSADAGSRHFTYSDSVGRVLAPYRLSIAPMASFGLEAYPLASTNVPVLRDLGFRGRFSHAFALDSKTPDGGKIETNWTRFGGELVERVLVPGPHALEMDVFVGGDASYFNMSTHSQVEAALPAARTIAVRFGFSARLLVAGRFSLMLGGAYLAVTSPGAIYDHFRDAHVAGVDGDFGAALGLLPGIEARLATRYTRYFSKFKPVVGDAYVAGGALDEQLQFGLGVRYAH
ncbi:MAG: hypothetical protein ABI488_08885 [Polyangiaceae bacterium]